MRLRMRMRLRLRMRMRMRMRMQFQHVPCDSNHRRTICARLQTKTPSQWLGVLQRQNS
jgi:hypothetical protein